MTDKQLQVLLSLICDSIQTQIEFARKYISNDSEREMEDYDKNSGEKLMFGNSFNKDEDIIQKPTGDFMALRCFKDEVTKLELMIDCLDGGNKDG